MTTELIQWEYTSFDKTPYDSVSAAGRCAKLGNDGWELVAITYSEKIDKTVFYFKRPIIQSPDKQEP